jgi:DNA-binding CsgD family transcriptional regulator
MRRPQCAPHHGDALHCSQAHESYMTANDYKKVLEIIHLAYSIDNREEMWRVVREKLEKLVGFSGAVWLPGDAATWQFVFKDLLPYRSLLRTSDGNFTERHRAILDLLLPHLSNLLHNLYLREVLCQAPDNGVIVLGGDGTVRLMNDAARRALNGHNGHPLQLIPNPDLGAEPALFQTGAGLYKVRSTTVRWGGFRLTKREQEIAALVIRGWGNREIAESLCITEQTVKDHLHDIFAKVKICRRSQLAAKLLEPVPLTGEHEAGDLKTGKVSFVHRL